MACIHSVIVLLLSLSCSVMAINLVSEVAPTAVPDVWTRAPTFPMPTPDPPKRKAPTTTVQSTPGEDHGEDEAGARRDNHPDTETWTRAPFPLKPKPAAKLHAPPLAPNASTSARISLPILDNSYNVTFAVGNLSDGSSGQFVVRVFPQWAPNSADRFRALVNEEFFDNNRFFRVIPGFLVQFGIAADPVVTAQWSTKTIQDDVPLDIQNLRGRLAFAASGPGTRSTQIFINLADNLYLDDQGFAPFAEVVSGMDVVDQLYSLYGEGEPLGPGPKQTDIESQGNAYLDLFFPRLSYVQSARIVVADEEFRLSIILLGLAVLIVGGAWLLQRTGVSKKHPVKRRWNGLLDAAVHEP